MNAMPSPSTASKTPMEPLQPLWDPTRPPWEIRFEDVSHQVLSVMPGESPAIFLDPLLGAPVAWEQDVYCPTCTLYNGSIAAVYRAYGTDGQWRMGLAWSDDGRAFQRQPEPVFHALPSDPLVESVRRDPARSVSYGDSRLVAREDGVYVLLFNVFQHHAHPNQELAVATTRDFVHWTMHGRAFAGMAPHDQDVIPEKAPWRLPHPAVVTRLAGGRLVAARILGRYWMYLNCLSTIGPPCLCAATSDDLIRWELVCGPEGSLLHPMPLRAGRFDSFCVDTTAAVLRHDGILLIYNGINDDPAANGDPRLSRYAHYPAQALFDAADPTRLLARSETPFRGADPALEALPRVFWHAPLYESWSLVPHRGELLLYWNHGFGRRSVGLWKADLVGSGLLDDTAEER